jgi:arylsulfatase A-like enzyme
MIQRFVFALLLSAIAACAANPPNIIVLLADDLGYGDLSGYGHPKFKTPNLDRMATEGAKLTQFNSPMAFCAPSRASLLTGRYPFRCGMNGNPAPDGASPAANEIHLPESEVLLPQILKQSGYATGMIGKWHLGHAKPEWLPTRRGFDDYFGIPYSNDMRPVQLLESETRVEYPVVQATLTQRYTARALDFITRNRARPFFLYLAHAMPHKPLAASEDFYKKSGAGLYGDVIAELDWSVGRVLARLKELGLEEKTLVVFTSDNGATFGGSTGGLRGMKGSSYEGGYRVPCIARWPGTIPAGHVSAQPAVMMDLFATALAVAGVSPPGGREIDGRNILPLFTSDALSPHDVVFGQVGARLATVRDARWKLHVLAPGPGLVANAQVAAEGDPRAPDGVSMLAPYEQAKRTELPGVQTGDASKAMQLFDLKADPAEQRDVTAQHPAEVTRLKAIYDAANRDVPPSRK